MINKLNVCLSYLPGILICFSLSRPGVVPEQKSSHFEMQRGQKSPVAVGEPGSGRPATARQDSAGGIGPPGPTAGLPHPGERGDGGGLLLWAPSLLHRGGTVWVLIRARAGKTSGRRRRRAQSQNERLVVPAITSRPSMVPVSAGAEELRLQPDELPVSRISGAAVVHVPLRVPFFYSRHSRFWLLGCCHGKQPATAGPVCKGRGLLERGRSRTERPSGTRERPTAGAVPAGDSGGAGRRLAGRRGTRQPRCRGQGFLLNTPHTETHY